MKKISLFFASSYSYWLYLTLLTYFTIFYLNQVIYVVWSWKALPFIFAFNFFWACHMLLFSIIPILIIKLIRPLQKHSRAIKSFVCWLATIAITFPNFLYYEYYQGPPSISVTGQAADPHFLKTVLPFFTDPYNIIFYFLIPALIVFFYNKLTKKTELKITKTTIFLSLIICIILGLLGKEMITKGLKKEIYSPENNPYNPLYYMYITNNNPFKRIKHTFGTSVTAKITQSDLEFAKKYLKEKFPKNPTLSRSFNANKLIQTTLSRQLDLPAKATPNIVILVMESFSTFHLTKKITPFLTNFEKYYPQSVTFKNFLATSDQTVKGQHSIFCGQYPTVHGKISTDFPNLKTNCLPHILRSKKQYSSHAFNGVNSAFHNKHHYFLKVLGFDSMMGTDNMEPDFFVPGAWGASDLSSLRFSLHKIKEFKRPYLFQFMSVNYHTPFKLPDDYKTLDIDEQYIKSLPLAQQILHYDDASLKHFFEKAKTLPDYNNTIFIITADTGGGHSQQKLHTEFELFEIRNKIPLIIFSPLFKKLKKPLILNNIANQYHIAPLLLDMINLKAENSFVGLPKSLYSDQDRSIVSEKNSYAQDRFPSITQVYNMQYTLLGDANLIILNGFHKYFATPESLINNQFADSIEEKEKNELYQKFVAANQFWLKVYMPLLHFNKLL